MTGDGRGASLDGIRVDSGFEVLGRRRVCEGDVVVLSRHEFRLPNGHEAEHDVIELPPVVAVVPLLVASIATRSPSAVISTIENRRPLGNRLSTAGIPATADALSPVPLKGSDPATQIWKSSA